MEILKAILFGIVEGITEWLPVSSTGHMIILNEFVSLNQSPEFISVFLVVIQLGAVLAVVVLFWNTLWPFQRRRGNAPVIKRDKMALWGKILLACIPAAVVGVLFDSVFERLFYHALPVAAALAVFGVAFLVVERKKKHTLPAVTSVEQLRVPTVLGIGVFQLISAIFPGTSRSGATIVGARMLGVSRETAAEFTFCLAVPVMAGASLLRIWQYGLNFTGEELAVLGAGMLTAFLVSLAVVKLLMAFIRKHDFQVFGWYRIVLGGIVAGLAVFGVLS